jgi:hypothetical protein
MTRVRCVQSLTACVAVAVALLVGGNVQAQKTKGKTRPATTKQLMKGIVAPTCGELKKLLEEKEVNWENVGVKAAVLNEAGYLLLDDGRCPDADWAKASEALKSTSAAVLEAVGKKDAAAANEAFKKLTADGCAACHKVHKT